jgi:tetratricopeptide (TPR) repeat protein
MDGLGAARRCAARTSDGVIVIQPTRLGITIASVGEQHVSVGQTYNNMALVYADQGDYPKALEYYQKALGITIASVEKTKSRPKTQWP